MKYITPIIALLAALGLADYANMLEQVLDSIPAWIQAASLVVTAAAATAAAFPTPKFDARLKKIRDLLDSWALNFGNAKSKDADD